MLSLKQQCRTPFDYVEETSKETAHNAARMIAAEVRRYLSGENLEHIAT